MLSPETTNIIAVFSCLLTKHIPILGVLQHACNKRFKRNDPSHATPRVKGVYCLFKVSKILGMFSEDGRNVAVAKSQFL
jgi:hypothetical protein